MHQPSPACSFPVKSEGVDVIAAVVAEEKGSVVGVEVEPEVDGADEWDVTQVDEALGRASRHSDTRHRRWSVVRGKVERVEELAIMRPCWESPISPVFYKSGPLLGLKVEDPDGFNYLVKSGVSQQPS